MKPTLFLSDLHLSPDASGGARRLSTRSRAGPARHAAAVYILGDLFDCVDRRRPAAPIRSPRDVADALAALRRSAGVAVVRGARQSRFPAAAMRFARATGATIAARAVDRRRRRHAPRRVATATSSAPATSTTSGFARGCARALRAAGCCASPYPLRRGIAWLAAAQEPCRQCAETGVDHGRRRGRGRRHVPPPRRRAA